MPLIPTARIIPSDPASPLVGMAGIIRTSGGCRTDAVTARNAVRHPWTGPFSKLHGLTAPASKGLGPVCSFAGDDC